MMKVWTLKLIGIPVITIANLVAGFLPYFFISRNIRLSQGDGSSSASPVVSLSRAMKRFLSLANFFCGGVFLATCLIGLYPGVNSKFKKILKENPSILHYPYAGLLLALGFFLVWLLEVLMHGCIHSGHEQHSSDQAQHSNDVEKSSRLVTAQNGVVDTLLQDDQTSRSTRESVDHEPHSHVPFTDNLLGSVMLTFALGSHSIIEGLGFGVMDELITSINMLVTIIAHEAVCAVSLGVNIASRRTSFKAAVLLLIVFSLLIPIGIAIGLIVGSLLKSNVLGDVTVASLQGIAAGTFIYVVFIEILPKEMSQRKDSLLRLCVMILGFSVIAVMKLAHSQGEVNTTRHNQSSSLDPASP